MWFYKKKLKTKHGIWNSCEGETPITSFSSVLKRERLLFMCSIQSRWSWAIYKIAQWYVVSMMKWRLRVWLPALAIFSFLFLFCNSSFTTWHNVISCNGRTRIMPRAIRVRHAHQVPHAPYSFHIFLREIIFPCDPICPDPWCKCLYHHNKNNPPSPPFSGVLDITRIGFTM